MRIAKCSPMSLLDVRRVRQILGVNRTAVVASATASATVFVVRLVRWMGNHFVALRWVLGLEELLEADDAGQQKSQLTDDERLEGDQGQETEDQGQESGGLKLEQQE